LIERIGLIRQKQQIPEFLIGAAMFTGTLWYCPGFGVFKALGNPEISSTINLPGLAMVIPNFQPALFTIKSNHLPLIRHIGIQAIAQNHFIGVFNFNRHGIVSIDIIIPDTSIP